MVYYEIKQTKKNKKTKKLITNLSSAEFAVD